MSNFDFKREDKREWWECKHKFVTGDLFRIKFYKEETSKANTYWVFFEITRNRKNENYLEITGRSGLKGLLWAKSNILEFENFIRNSSDYINRKKKIQIFISADDNRRFKIYQRGLRDSGYRVVYWFGQKGLLNKL